MVYSILKLMNFAHGDVYIFRTFICYTLLTKYHINPVVAIGFIVLFTLFLKYHPYGKAILCVSEDIPAASLMGIPINIIMVWCLAGTGLLRGQTRMQFFRCIAGAATQSSATGSARRTVICMDIVRVF
jgi:branched-subunit amino acid ABC-type transport system permease component